MSNGIWSATQGGEQIQQPQFVRHRLLIVSPGFNQALPWPEEAASGFASLDPNTIAPPTTNPTSPRGNEGGPHFIMSGETSDESHTYGFEFCLFLNGVTTQAAAGPGGYTVTVWLLIENTQDPRGFLTPLWAAMAPNTGVQINQMWHSFDINAEAVRFQITNTANNPALVNEAIGIAFAEL